MSLVDAVVLGAGGATGLKCVEKLLEENKTVRAVVRSPDNYKDKFPKHPNLTVVSGDVTDRKSIESAVRGAKGIIFAVSGNTFFSPSAVDKQGVGTTAEVAKETGAHVVLVSSMLVTPKNRFHPVRLILNNIRWGLMDAKFAGENLLRSSGTSYTIIRPGGLTNDVPGKAKLIASQRDIVREGKVSRADTAAVCVAALTNPKAKGVTLELKTDSKTPPAPGDLDSLFDDLQPGIYQ